MSACRIAPQATRDLEEITAYLSERNLTAAQALLTRFRSAFDLLGKRPTLGHRRTDLVGDSELRFWPVGTYLVVYRPGKSGIDVVRVLSGYRDIRRLLSR